MVMKDLVILLLVALILFLIWNGRQGAGYSAEASPSPAGPSDAPVSPDVTQVIIEQIQKRLPKTYPLETLFIKSRGDNVYDARFMFFNTEGYFGTQYDVKANVGSDGSVNIMSQSETAVTGDAANPGYQADKYQPYDVIESNLDQQLRDALKANKGTPGGLIGTPRELASGSSAPAPGPSPSY
jgi:hypothetical protein